MPSSEQRQVQAGGARGHGDRVRPRRRAPRTPARTRRPAAPGPPSPTLTASAAAAASSSPSHGRITGMFTGARLAPAGALARATRRPAAAGPRPGRPRLPAQAARRARETSASRRVTPLTPRAGPNSDRAVAAHDVAAAPAASSSRLVSVPLPMLNTSSVTSDSAASRLARAMSSVKTKSIVCVPSPRMSGGWPAAIRSIHRISTSVYRPWMSIRGPVHVEVAQRDVVEAAHRVEAAQQALVERLRGTVEGVVGVRVLVARRSGTPRPARRPMPKMRRLPCRRPRRPPPRRPRRSRRPAPRAPAAARWRTA